MNFKLDNYLYKNRHNNYQNHSNKILFKISNKEDLIRHFGYVIAYSFVLIVFVSLFQILIKKLKGKKAFNLFCFINDIDSKVMLGKLEKNEIEMNNIIEELLN